MSCEMQYIIWRGTFRPAARHAAKDAEKFMAIVVDYSYHSVVAAPPTTQRDGWARGRSSSSLKGGFVNLA